MRRPLRWVVLGVVTALSLSACQSGGSESSSGVPSSGAVAGDASPSQTASPEAAVTFSPAAGTDDVRPDAQVVVTADSGTLTSVEVKSEAGKLLAGTLDPSGATWRSSGILGTGTDYTATAVATNADGVTRTETATFTTLRPTSTAGAIMIPGDDWEVGVGMPVVVQFSRTVKNKDAALKTLSVKTTPQVEGAWHWMNGQAIWWRPKEYWPAGTKVEVTAALNGAELSDGVWGKRTYTTKFTVGSAVVSTVDVAKHTLTVTKDGKVVRTLPVTTGLPQAKYRTRNGIKVIMDKKPVEQMDAASTGTQKDDPEYYNLKVKWAMRLTWSGEYLHAAPWSVGSQGRANVSHGCTGMSTANAKWLYDYSKIGDVVAYKNSPRPLEFGNGYTAWEMTWAKWSQGTAGKPTGDALAATSPSPAASLAASPSSATGSSLSASAAAPATGASPNGIPDALTASPDVPVLSP